jgi:hypothetical protein
MLSKHIPLPSDLKPKKNGFYSTEEFINTTAKAYGTYISNEDRKRQRDEAFIEAYASVPRPILMKLSSIFQDDCHLFNYSCDIERFYKHNVSPFYFKFS